MVEGPDPMRAVGVVIRPVVTFAFVVTVTMCTWVASIKLTGVTELTTRLPPDVARYLFTDQDAARNRSEVLAALRQTLFDAGIGFVTGLTVAVMLATVMVLFKGIETATMPLVMVARTVPLVALAPVITLVLGNGFWCVAAMSGIVVLFPALVNIMFGLRSATPQMRDVVKVYGGSSWEVMRRVGYPSALPSILAAIRISVPGAITGALIAEYFTTSDSVGKAVNTSLSLFQYDKLWSLIVVVTAASLLGYFLAQFLESLVLTRYGIHSRRG